MKNINNPNNRASRFMAGIYDGQMGALVSTKDGVYTIQPYNEKPVKLIIADEIVEQTVEQVEQVVEQKSMAVEQKSQNSQTTTTIEEPKTSKLPLIIGAGILGSLFLFKE